MTDARPQRDLERWFLTCSERGNGFSAIDGRHAGTVAYTTGNRVEPLVHGAVYFRRLLEAIGALDAGDQLYFTDWRGDPDERLDGTAGTEVGTVLAEASRRGVAVKGLVWRSHLDRLRFSSGENRHLGEQVNAAGGQVLLDQRVGVLGSHHQKVVVIRHRERAERDVAFVGGIDLCHSRRDDETHEGDPQRQAMALVYGATPPWHDVQVAIRGPAVGDVETTFRERWEDPAPLSRNPIGILHDRLLRTDRRAGPLPPPPPDPPAAGGHAVQVLRTFPRRGYPFAPMGEHSVARGYQKAIRRARRVIYLEDQFLWSEEVARTFADALRAEPDLHLVAVVPRFFDQTGALSLTPNQVGRELALDVLRAAGGDRVAVYDLENLHGVPVYVHAKVCVIDDVWACVGSDNFNRRSWSLDSEISCAVLDEARDERQPLDPAGLGDCARVYARDLRLRLWCEHLGRDAGDDRALLDPVEAVTSIRRAAEELDHWYQNGRRGERPPGRVRPHRAVRLSAWSRLWAGAVYRSIYDRDGRPAGMRRADAW